MIIKKKKFKYRKKKLTREEEKKISEMRKNQFITETVNIENRNIEISRPMFFIEAKEIYFNS